MTEKSARIPASRRSFLKGAAGVGAGLGLAGLSHGTAAAEVATGAAPSRLEGQRSMIGVPFEQHDEVRVGIVGVGNRGYGVLGRFLNVPNVRVTAIADVYEPRARSAAARVVAAGQPEPALYTGGDVSYETAPEAAYQAALDASRRARSEQPADHHGDYRALCARDDVDFVFTATPWEWHHPVAMAAMRAGKHVGVELPLATDLQHLWELVDTSEQTRRHCIQMENVSYGRNELRLLRMAHEALFGEVTYGAGGYIHDLRHNMFFRNNRDTEVRGLMYRRPWHTRLDACFYPNHGFAPIAACMDINRGDRFVSLSSSTTPPLGLAAYREQHLPKDHPAWNEEYVKGDRNICLLETEKGRQVRIEHNVTSPHPYTRINSLAGTNGVFEDFTPTRDMSRIYLEPDMSGHAWGSWEDYVEYDHWLWQDIGGGGGGHGGIDYLLVWRLVQTMRLGLVPDIDVYDSAVWSAPFALSAASLRQRGIQVPYPDFTRGEWQQYRPGLDSPRPQE